MILDFNKIYVIESLSSNETQTGTSLHSDIIRRRLWGHENINSELCSVNSKSDFHLLLSRIEYEAKDSDVIPYLHFEIHGNPDGFCLNSDEQVNWYEFRARLTQINIFSRNRLWISLASCYGAFLYTTYSMVDKAPFYGYVGAWKKINIDDLSASFERYFDKLLENFDVQEAVEQLNLSNPNLPVEYKLYNSRDVFDKVYDEYEKNTYSEEGLEKRVNKIVELGLNDPRSRLMNFPEEFIRNFARKSLLNERENFRNKFYRQFLMLDLYPEVEERFE